VTATYQGKSLQMKVIDKCLICAGEFGIDLSEIAFSFFQPHLNDGPLQDVDWFVEGNN